MNDDNNYHVSEMTTLLVLAPRDELSTAGIEKYVASVTSSHTVKKIIVFNTSSTDGSESMKVELANMGYDVQVIYLDKMTTEGHSTKSEIQGLPWKNLELIVAAARTSKNPIFSLGRGSRLNDHLMWLACVISEGESVHVIGKDVHIDTYIPEKMFSNSQTTDGTFKEFLELKSYAMLNNYEFREYFLSSKLKGGTTAATHKGIQSSLKSAIEKGMVDKIHENKEVFYRLNASGWPKALSSWSSWRSNNEELVLKKRLVITAGRMPDPSDNEPQKGQFSLPQYLKNLEPFDGFISLIQRYDKTIEGRHILSFEEGIEKFKDHELSSKLQMTAEILNRKQDMDDIPRARHILVINPDGSKECTEELLDQILHSLTLFEKINGLHKWAVDMTAPLASISHILSMFAFSTGSEINYVLKKGGEAGPSGESVSESLFASADHCLRVPGRMAVENIGSKKGGKMNTLVAFVIDETDTKSASLAPWETSAESNPVEEGLSANDIKEIAIKHKLKGVTGAERNLRELHASGFVINLNPDGGNKQRRFILSNEGRFLARLFNKK